MNKREEKFVITIFRNFRFANQTQQLINQGQFCKGDLNLEIAKSSRKLDPTVNKENKQRNKNGHLDSLIR